MLWRRSRQLLAHRRSRGVLAIVLLPDRRWPQVVPAGGAWLWSAIQRPLVDLLALVPPWACNARSMHLRWCCQAGCRVEGMRPPQRWPPKGLVHVCRAIRYVSWRPVATA
eukprot:3898277-Prorocentrum_lima.AAC.1